MPKENIHKTLSRLNLGGKAPRCPLCYEWMEKKFDSARGFFIFACHVDRVACRVDDPFVGRWEGNREKIACPNPRCDETPMRFFATSTGFVKSVCPKCKASISNAEPDRDKSVEHTPDKPGVLQ